MKMKCTNCDAVYDDGSMFCVKCGNKVEEVKEIFPETIFCMGCGERTSSEFDFCQECGSTLTRDKDRNPVTTQGQKTIADKTSSLKTKKSGKTKKAGVAILLLVVLIFSGVGFINRQKNPNIIAYYKDEVLKYANLDNSETVKLTNNFTDKYMDYTDINDKSLDSYIVTRDDGRYLFYPEFSNGKLAYYWKDIKAKAKDDITTRVDSDITSLPFVNRDGSKVFYLLNEEERLYVYDRISGEKVKLDENVKQFFVDDVGDYVVYTKLVDNEEILFEIVLDGIKVEKNKIDNIDLLERVFVNDKMIYYYKDGMNLFQKKHGEEKLKVASQALQVITYDREGVYYLKSEEASVKLSEVLNDDFAKQDAEIVAPIQGKDSPEPKYPNEDNYLYTYWIPSSWGNEYNYETNEVGYWDVVLDYDKYDEAVRQYEQKYSIWEDEYNYNNSQYHYDYKFYVYKQKRDELRKVINNEKNDLIYNQYSIYYAANGTETLVASDVVHTFYDRQKFYSGSIDNNSVVIYKKFEETTFDKINLSDLIDSNSDWGSFTYADDVISKLHERTNIENMRKDDGFSYIASKTNKNLFKYKDTYLWSIGKNNDFYYFNDYQYRNSVGTLMKTTIKDDVASNPIKIDDDVLTFSEGNHNGKYYYFKDAKDGIGDLYLEGNLIGRDVKIEDIYNFKGTDTLLYTADYSINSKSGTLCIYAEGKETKIASDVNSFCAESEKKISYIANYNKTTKTGDFMLYQGKDKITKIDSDVTALVWNPKMKWYKGLY